MLDKYSLNRYTQTKIRSRGNNTSNTSTELILITIQKNITLYLRGLKVSFGKKIRDGVFKAVEKKTWKGKFILTPTRMQI